MGTFPRRNPQMADETWFVGEWEVYVEVLLLGDGEVGGL